MNPHISEKLESAPEPVTLADAFSYVADDLAAVEHLLQTELTSEASLILDVSRYLIDSGGKRFRPALHLLSARLLGLDDPIRYRTAAALECIHTASLLHDDVVDGASLRRGKPAANVVWGDHAAVLVGDFLLTTAVKWILETGDLSLTRKFASVCGSMAEGEAYQLNIARTRRLREDDYLHVVGLKTAELISLCCYSAAMMAKIDGHQFDALKKFGHCVGMAFQVVDDALDYCSETEELGKAIGKDLEEGKITLPMLYALDKADPSDKKVLESILSSDPLDLADLPQAQEIIHRYHGIDYALDHARRMIDDAGDSLQAFDPSPAKAALLQLADFTVSRSK